LPDAAREALATAEAVLVSDYGCGVATVPDLRVALSQLVQVVPLVWDPHVLGSAPVPGAWLVTPNSREAAHFAPQVEAASLRGETARATELRHKWSARHVVVTRGSSGAVLVLDAVSAAHVVTPTRPVSGETTGAGNCFAATAATALAAGRHVSAAVTAAVIRASDYVAAGKESTLTLKAGPGPMALS
jgi:D-beta-D-heptose 7-phosphate kinase / D-beta-D-heptose 1-phosphate adenosyltransferase